MTRRHDAGERQIQAARPDVSTWLTANAGSGKTRVLTDRVARLLLEDVQPQNILCLTYTKAAAGEMQNRLFRRLGEWAMLDDATLADRLADLGIGARLEPDRLAYARTLFARAIETPGGLKIQTIHSFCASLLRRFPLEAGVSPQFTEMEDRAAVLLRAQIVEDFADGPQSGLVDGIAAHITDSTLDKLTAALTGRREAFATPPDWPELLARFGLPEDADPGLPSAIAFDGSEAALIAACAPILATQSATMASMAETLSEIDWSAPGQRELDRLYPLFLFTGNGQYLPEAKTKSVPTRKAQEALGPLLEPFQDLMQRVAAAREAELALAAAQKTRALYAFAAAFLPEYERRKQRHGWLDFDDLILKARQLLTDPAVAAWVLYRLDGGIDHILVDEAQDTSPAQWDVIEKLTREFTSGASGREGVDRTIFVVGDKKQSIYSFQGADPAAFDRMQAEFSRRLYDIGAPFENLTLDYSFRSSDAVLRLVDLVFRDQGSAGFGDKSEHIAFKSDLPGRVDLWPVVEKTGAEEDRAWTDPLDRRSERHHDVILAERIAGNIRAMIERGETIPEDGPEPGEIRRRRVRAGDFLILVPRRSALFAEIIRACKSAGLPIAGADRLKVGAELAVRDLAALLRFLATPDDDLSLATALKSPLLGWSEQALFDLAHRRPERTRLWQALRDRAAEFPETLAILHDLRDAADFLRPYDLIERTLTRHDGRRRLLGRLGAEAEDGINALLSQALAYERSDIPGLTGFLVWMETDDLEIKRQAGGAGNMVRVMTVHGAKGLEAPIVILPDTGPRKPPPDEEIMLAGDVPLWKTATAASPRLIAAAREAARERAANERLRLLYVALTRAEKWLIVAMAGDPDKTGDSWYRMVEAAMREAGATEEDGILRLSHGEWAAPPLAETPDPVVRAVPLPGFFRHPPPAGAKAPATLSPSDLGGAKAMPGDAGLDEDAAMLRGTRIHLLLEHLPGMAPAGRQAACTNILRDTPQAERATLLAEAETVLDEPALAAVFAPDALAEVPVTALVRGQRIHGTIDRLILTGDAVLAVDFKTNATVPDTPDAVPEGLLRQMGAYGAALAQIYPGRRIETAILWTRTARLMALPHDLVTDALDRTACLDLADGHS
ncbi:MAG: double-strand break repair helicase AddA [Jhaorihella sp.]